MATVTDLGNSSSLKSCNLFSLWISKEIRFMHPDCLQWNPREGSKQGAVQALETQANAQQHVFGVSIAARLNSVQGWPGACMKNGHMHDRVHILGAALPPCTALSPGRSCRMSRVEGEEGRGLWWAQPSKIKPELIHSALGRILNSSRQNWSWAVTPSALTVCGVASSTHHNSSRKWNSAQVYSALQAPWPGQGL